MSKQKRLDTRYAWIEASLRYTGKFEKVSYGEWFDINAPQISADQSGFVRVMNHEFAHRERQAEIDGFAPVLEIIKGKIAILRDLPSRPVFDVPEIREWLRTSATIPFVKIHEFSEITPPEAIMREICNAILRKQPLRIAMETASGTSWKDISPHAIIDASGRMHARAYDHLEGRFSDFAISHVVDVGPYSRNLKYIGGETDAEWTETSDVVLEFDDQHGFERLAQADLLVKSRPLSRRISISRALSRFLAKEINPGLSNVSIKTDSR